MDDGTRKTDSVSRRTRSHSKEYFKNCHNQLKSKDQENGGASVSAIGNLKRNEDEGVEILISTSDDDGVVEISMSDEDDGIEISTSDDDGVVEISTSDEDEISRSDTYDDSGIEILNCSAEDGEDVEDSCVGILRSDEDVDNGVDDLKCDEDDNSVIMLSSSEDDDNGVDDLKCDEDEDIVEMLSSGEDDDDDGVEYLGEVVKSDDSSLQIETESISGSGLKVGGLDEVVSSLAKRYGNTQIEADSLSNSGGKARIKPLVVEQIHRHISVDSDSSTGTMNSCEDSDGSVDSQVSEFEATSEEEDELFDEDYKCDESSSSESSDSTFHATDKNKENLSDTVEDERTLGTHDKYRRKKPRKESGTELQEKDDESDEGCNGDDQRNNLKEKLPTVRKSKRRNTEKENDDEIYTKKRKVARRNQKGDDEEEILQDQVECDRYLNSVSKSQSKKPELGKCSSHLPFESEFPTAVKISGQQYSKEQVKLGSRKSHSASNLDVNQILIDLMSSMTKENQYSIDEDALADDALPLKFRFEDEVVHPPEKSEWEKHIDSLFHDLELGLRESETDCSNNVSTMENDGDMETTDEVDESIAAACSRGKHHAILDEQIGFICQYCDTLIMDIRHVLPDFHTPARDRRGRMNDNDESSSPFFSGIQFQGSASSICGSTSFTKGTVWDLIPGVKTWLQLHQREGFEFIWRNIAGDISLERVKQAVADDARGCIIAHGAGTGKTLLAIAFLQSFMKLYPGCRPVIMAPRGILLNWETEFKKWKFNVEFHILKTKELSGEENVATRLLGQQANCGKLSTRLSKMYSWFRGGSILGISYTMFERLAGENGREQGDEVIREVLLQKPDLLVLDEGHTVRNDKSKLWKALMKVTTHRRIILSGTLFQNSLGELYNTFRVANPKLENQDSWWARKRNLNNKSDALKLRNMIDPFVHVQDSTVLEESLPGLQHTLVFLHPTECQKTLLKGAIGEGEFLRRIRMVSLVSVHPSIAAVMERYPVHHSMLQELKSDVDAGVKTKFLMKLIYFSDALGERVLVFSQFLDSLAFIKDQLESNFSWNEGREVLYMDGQMEDSKRQATINSFNDDTSRAKVLLASVIACSEGINLTAASRVVLLDTLWNPSREKQAVSRAYRLGQNKVVHVYRLFMSAIDERQYAHQFLKEQMSNWIFSLGERPQASRDRLFEDKVMEAMRNLDNFNHIFENIMCQPEESDLIRTFGLHEEK